MGYLESIGSDSQSQTLAGLIAEASRLGLKPKGANRNGEVHFDGDDLTS